MSILDPKPLMPADAATIQAAADQAAADAAASAQAAEDAAALVGAPTDTVVAGLLSDTATETGAYQRDNYAKVRVVRPGQDLQAALTAGGRVRISGTHVISTQLTIPSNTYLDAEPGAVLDISGMPDGVAALAAVGSYATAKALSVDATEGASTVTVVSDTVGLAPGDYVKISSNQVFGSTSQPRGEIVRIVSITDTTLTLEDPLQDSYPVASDGKVERVAFVENVTIDGLNIVGPATARNVIGLSFLAVRNLTLRNLRSRNVHNAVVHLIDVIESSVSDCNLTDCKLAGYGYGIAVLYACQDITITNITGVKMRHAVTIGGGTSRRGIARRIATSNSTAAQCDAAGFDCHPGGEFVSFTGCHVIGSTNEGITMQGGRFTITGCTIEGSGSYGILVQNLTIRGLDGVISNNVIRKAATRGIAVIPDVTAAYMVWSGLTINGNTVTDSGMGITCETSSTNYVEGLVLSGNTVRRCTSSRVVILRGTQGAVVQGNSLHGPAGGLEVLRLFTALNTLVCGNHIDGAGTAGNGINLVTSTGVIITGNQIRNGTGTGVIGDSGSTGGVYGDNRSSYTTKEALAGTGWAKANNL